VAGIRSASLSHETKRDLKTKLQIYTEPQAGINMLLSSTDAKALDCGLKTRGFGIGATV
jgi:hypothetical protein